MRIAYFGSGEFGLPTLRSLVARHDVVQVVTQPDRPAGRRRALTATPIGQYASGRGIETIKPPNVNEPDVIEFIRKLEVDVFLVIAYGQKLVRALLEECFAINLHASLLPKYRGAAPINHAIINGERVTGLSVITLAERMDAGRILGQTETPIDPHETAGELHDRLAKLGPDLVNSVIERREANQLTSREQDESQVTVAPKLTKADGTVTFNNPAKAVRNRINGLTPWPGCRVRLGDDTVRLHRASVESGTTAGADPGTLLPGGVVACAEGSVRLLAVQPSGGKLMSFEAFARGRSIDPGMILEPLDPQESAR